MAVKSFFKNHWPLLVLAAITIFAACVRVSILRESFWIDELHTAWTIDGSFAEIFSRAKMGNQGPAYFVVLWFWKHIAGMGEISLRLPSWFAGVAIPAAIYGCVRKFDVEEPAKYLVPLFAALLAATDPYAIFYSQEARPYAWVMLGSVLHFTAFAMWLRKSTRGQMIGVVVGAAALFFLHYTTALLFVAEGVYAALVIASLARKASGEVKHFQVSLRQLLILQIVLAILCLPALPTLKLLAERKQNWEVFVRSPLGSDLLQLFPGALAIILVAIGYLPGRLSRHWKNDRPPVLPLAMRVEVWAAIWLFVPLCVTWLSTHWNVALLFYSRYLVAALPASWILMGQSLRAAEYAWLRFVFAGLLLFLWCRQPELMERLEGKYSRDENWREAVAFISEHYMAEPGIVYVNAGLIEERDLPQLDSDEAEQLREYLLLPVRGPYRLPADDIRPYADPNSVFERKDRARHVWIIYRQSTRINDDIFARLAFLTTDPPFTHWEHFGKVHVLCMPPNLETRP